MQYGIPPVNQVPVFRFAAGPPPGSRVLGIGGLPPSIFGAPHVVMIPTPPPPQFSFSARGGCDAAPLNTRPVIEEIIESDDTMNAIPSPRVETDDSEAVISHIKQLRLRGKPSNGNGSDDVDGKSKSTNSASSGSKATQEKQVVPTEANPAASLQTPLSSVDRIQDSEYVVFSGGAAKGISLWSAFVTVRDAVLQLTGRDLVSQIRGAAGTSIGSLIAFALCASTDLNTVTQLITDEQLWNGGIIDRYATPECLLNDCGFTSHDALLSLVDHVFQQLGVRRNITFAEFQRLSGGREFVCNAACITRQTSIVFSSTNTPHRSVREALAMSMCVPGVFTPFIKNGDAFVDGGIYNNFLVGVFPMERTLGITVEKSSLTVDDIRNQNVLQFFVSVVTSIDSMSQTARIADLSPENRKRIVYVGGLPTITTPAKVTVDPAEMKDLWESGVASGLWYLVQDLYVSYILKNYVYKRLNELNDSSLTRKVLERLERKNTITTGTATTTKYEHHTTTHQRDDSGSSSSSSRNKSL